MTAAALWTRIVAGTVLAALLLVVASPARPPRRLALPAAVAAGAVCGAALFAVVLRRRPRLPPRSAPLPVAVAKHGVLGLWAANEEILWRRVVLGELLAAGTVGALALSTVAFALAHRAHRGVHLGTGAAFGALYLATGVLAAAVAAHWTYNALVAAHVERETARRGRSP